MNERKKGVDNQVMFSLLLAYTTEEHIVIKDSSGGGGKLLRQWYVPLANLSKALFLGIQTQELPV